MDLTTYNPEKDKFLVFQSIGNPIEELPGILSGFLLAMVNDYNFRIENLEESPFSEVFTSKINWWGNMWKNMSWMHGIMNFKNPDKKEIQTLETQTISEKFPNSQILRFYTNKNLIPNIIKNPKYEKKLIEVFGSTKVSYRELYNLLFSGLEENYVQNYNFIMDELKSYKKQVVIKVDETVKLEELEEVRDYDFIYFLGDNESYFQTIKKEFSETKFSRIKQQKSVGDETKIFKIGKLLEFHFIINFPEIKNYTKDDIGDFIGKIINQE
jgi:hypothetical protein